MTTRLVPAFFHLAGFVGMALLARRLFRRQTAKWTIALSVYALVPMSNYFGKMPFNEPVGLCCIVWALSPELSPSGYSRG
jgi:4-amino-4-deoxy-L-arabinose transferase-like glycosyltransferase